jgi:hypothetical protein
MSVTRSIDRTDLGGATVTLTTTSETVVLASPTLQTPKDTSFIVMLGTIAFATGAGATGLTLRFRQGSGVGGAVIGQPYVIGNVGAAQSAAGGIMATTQVQSTDYVQWTLTAQQTAATSNGTVSAATVLAYSF